MKHSKLCGEGSMISIHRESMAMSDKVTNWCPNCGAVAVDEEFRGGMIMFGGYRPLEFPKMTGRHMGMRLLLGFDNVEDIPKEDRETIMEHVVKVREAEG